MKAVHNEWRRADRLADTVLAVVVVVGAFAAGVVVGQIISDMSAAGLPRSVVMMRWKA